MAAIHGFGVLINGMRYHMRYYSRRTDSFTAVSDNGRVVTIEEYTNYLERDMDSGVVTSEVRRELLANGATVRQIGEGVYAIGVLGLIVRRENGNGD